MLVKLKTIAYTVFKRKVKNLLTKVPPASGATTKVPPASGATSPGLVLFNNGSRES